MVKKINFEYVLLSVILLFGLFLRLYNLGKPSFWIDEATSANVAVSIIEKGIPTLSSGWYYGGALFLHYAMALLGFIFGASEFSFRLVSVIFGLLTILLAYFIGKEYSKSSGIVCALFTSIFYLEVFFSRQSRYYQLFQLAFFASLYFLYKSRVKPNFIYLALICFFIAIDTHLEGLLLAPFFIIHILVFSKRYYKLLSILPIIPLFHKWFSAVSLSGVVSDTSANLASSYFGLARNMFYLLVLFVPGLIYAFTKKRRLTLLLILPALLTLIGIFTMQTFALRYAYFFIFPLIIYSSLLFSLLYDKYGKLMLIPIILLILIPSNLFFAQTYVNVIKPIDYAINDYSAPTTDYRALNESVISELASNTTLISLYSSDVVWYIRKPDFVVPFSLDGRGQDQVSFNNSIGETVDIYSGAKILDYSDLPSKPYNVIADLFSVSKLKKEQARDFNLLISNCSKMYSVNDLQIYGCLK